MENRLKPYPIFSSVSEPTLYEAMTEFHNIAQAVAFTSHEIALFHALSHSWNVARRPAVIEQWAEITSRNAGLTKDTLASARNKLVQTGVLYFEKTGNRAVPRYSFHALFGMESPFDTRDLQRLSRSKPPSKEHKPADLPGDLQRLSRSKPPSKCRVSDGVNGASYQVEGKYQEREKSALARPITDAFNDFLDNHPQEAANDLQAIADRINGLSPIWKKHPHLTGMEMADLAHPMTAKAFMALEDRDWSLLRDYLRAVIPEEWAAEKFWQPNQRSQFIRAIGDIIQKAEIWAMKAKWNHAA